MSEIPQPWVTICVPAYNAEKTLPATLDSLLRQDYPRFDLLVSDNQSTDRTREVVESYAARGVRYCYHGEGRPSWAAQLPAYIGGFANWNYALSQAQGEFLCLYHADDVYEPGIVRREVSLLQSDRKIGAVFTMLRRIGADGRPLRHGRTRLPPELRGREIFAFSEVLNVVLRHGNFLAAPSVMLRKKVFEAVGGFNERRFFTCADLELWLRIGQNHSLGILDEPLLNYRISPKQFGEQYNSLRTMLDYYYLMMDDLLTQPFVQAILQREALAFYRMERAADQITCAIHLLIKGEKEKALLLLKEAWTWPHFRAALRKPRAASQFLAGSILLLAAQFGMMKPLGRAAYLARESYIRWRREPVS